MIESDLFMNSKYNRKLNYMFDNYLIKRREDDKRKSFKDLDARRHINTLLISILASGIRPSSHIDRLN